MTCNQTVICGEIIQLGVLRYAPAGTPIVDCVVKHQSHQKEANITRRIYCELQAVALGDVARTISEMNLASSVKISGFLNRKNQKSQQLVLHINCITQI